MATLVLATVTFAHVPIAEAASINGYGTPSLAVDGKSGQIEFDPSLGMPDATFALGAGSALVPSGSSTWLSTSTPFGSVFGSSRNLPYLRLSVPSKGSSITIEFEQATPTQSGTAGWGFALGDVDAESVTITAEGPSGPLSSAQLGWSPADGAFNYCVASPRPTVCGTGSGSDLPVWNGARSTLEGNIGVSNPDTDGAAGWFRPAVAVTSLTLSASVISGIPNFQLWIAAIEDVAISGKVERSVSGSPLEPAAGVTLSLLDASGDPVLEDGEAVTTVTDDDGTYAFGDLQPVLYKVALDLPSGADPGGITERDANLAGGPAAGIDFSYSQSVPPDPLPEPEPEPEVAPDPETISPPSLGPVTPPGDGSLPPGRQPPDSTGRLPDTGLGSLLPSASACALVMVGLVVVWGGRRQRFHTQEQA